MSSLSLPVLALAGAAALGVTQIHDMGTWVANANGPRDRRFRIDPNEIQKVRVLRTVVGGREVFTAPSP